MRRSMAELSQMLEFSPPGCCRAQGESGRRCRIHPHGHPAPPARSHLWGIPGVHGLHDGWVLQLAVDDKAGEPLGQRVLGIAQHVPVVPNGTVRLPARAGLVLQLRQPLMGLLPVIVCEGAQGEARGPGASVGSGRAGGDTPGLTDGPGPEGVIVELVDVFILLPQGLEGVFILIQRAVLQGLGQPGTGSAPLHLRDDPAAHHTYTTTLP